MKHFLRTCPGTGVAAFTKWGPEEVALQVEPREIFTIDIPIDLKLKDFLPLINFLH